MKQTLTILILIAFVLTLAGCKEKEDDVNSNAASFLSKVKEYESQAEVIAQFGNQMKGNNSSKTEKKPESDAKTSSVESNVGEKYGAKFEETYDDTPYYPEYSSDDTVEDPDKREGVNQYRLGYDIGNCSRLKGKITVVPIFMDDFESDWTNAEMSDFIDYEITPALEFIERQAKRNSAKVNLVLGDSIAPVIYDNDIPISAAYYSDFDALSRAAYFLKYDSAEEMVDKLEDKYGTEVVCLTVFDKEGCGYSYTAVDSFDTKAEHTVLFSKYLYADGEYFDGQTDFVVAREILILFGAEDLYNPPYRRALAEKLYSSDIMLEGHYPAAQNTIGEATAFYLGWTDVPPKVIYQDNWAY